jgi:tetratricopeptide (TPR) repeat protein
VRDCLHEELAQAMGPLNDLYHLPDSVFNDDNFNTVLTGFDMLMLRVHYAPELRSGMNEAEAAARLPGILARLNPSGQGRTAEAKQIAPRSWVAAVEGSFGVGGNAASRVESADRMLSIAMAQGWNDNRLAFSYYAKGRALSAGKPAEAIAAFAEAARIYRATPGAQVQAAHVDMQLAAIALASGQAAQAVQFADRAIPVVKAAENASLLATVMLIKAEALDNLGQSGAAKTVRLDSLGWARYGFGTDNNIRARQGEIAALGARGNRG